MMMWKLTEFRNLGDRINSSGCEAAVTSIIRIELAKFRECQDLLCRKTFPQKIKTILYNSCVRSAMLHENETEQNEIGISQRTEGAIVRNMSGVKLMDRKSTKDLMQMLELVETVDQLAKANVVHWYGHVLRKDIRY